MREHQKNGLVFEMLSDKCPTLKLGVTKNITTGMTLKPNVHKADLHGDCCWEQCVHCQRCSRENYGWEAYVITLKTLSENQRRKWKDDLRERVLKHQLIQPHEDQLRTKKIYKKKKPDAEVRQLSQILQYSDNMFMSLMLANLNFH